MRRFIPALTLFLAACASRPEVAAPVVPPAAPQSRALVGMTASELIARLGSPAFQVREGASLKLQWRSPRCVLDAYLYPSAGAGGNVLRVTHVDTRLVSGADTSESGCLFALQKSS
jgi:hypothetical protein